jgi:RNA polymerase sigma-70 factor (ECF subfamily)
VDDLIQDVYLKIVSHGFRALRSFEMLQENSFFSFLKIVATNTVQDYSRRVSSARRGAREAPKAGLVFMDPESGRGPSSKLEREILLREIDRILIRCSHEPNFVRDHAIFWLYFSQGLTAKEIAGLPGVKLGVKGVESTLLRLTEQVKAALTQETKKPNRSL